MKGNNKHIDFEAFRRYRADEMTPEERNAFERELQKDPFLAEAFEGMEQLSPEDTAASVKELSQKITSPKRKRRIQLIASAASILLVVSLGVIWLQIQKDPIPELSEAKKIEAPAETPTKEKTLEVEEPITDSPEPETKPQPVADKTIEKEIKPIAAKVEAEEDVAITEFAEMSPKILPIEKKEPEVIAEVEKEEEIKTELAEALNGKVSEVVVSGQDAQPVKASNLVNTNNDIRIRGVSSIREKPTHTKTLRGKIISAHDKMPLPGVTLVEKGGSNGTITDVDGNFELLLSDSNSTVVVSFIGMKNKEISPTDSMTAVIELEQEQLALDEVVVVGYGVQKKQSVTGSTVRVETDTQARKEQAEPLGGYKDLRDYLKENAVLPDDYPKNKEVVRLKISLGPQGNIRSIDKLNNAPDELFNKAKKLILEGPEWKPALNDDKATDSSVTLRIVFRKSE